MDASSPTFSDEPNDLPNEGAPATGPGPAPRALSAGVKHQSWRHPQVRFWWMLAAFLVLGVAYLAYQQFSLRAEENRLIREGTIVNGTVKQIGEMYLPNHPFPPDSVAIIIYEFNGEKHTVKGKLEGRKTFIDTGEVVPLRIDPNDPTIWTGRQEPGPILSFMLAPLLALPTILIPLVACLLVRRRVLRTWATEPAALARVMSTQTSPLAPTVPAAKCVRLDDEDDRVFTVFVPHRVAIDDTLWIIAPASSPTQALAADWFVNR